MRGDEGDLERALTYGDRALEAWVSGTRSSELAEHYHLHADAYYWTGEYERALELSRLSARTGGLEPHSAEFVLRGAGMGADPRRDGPVRGGARGGRRAIATARRLGRPDNVVLNYSTTALREIYAVEEALERSETVVVAARALRLQHAVDERARRPDRRPSARRPARLVEREWPTAWDDALAVSAWEHWLITGRLAAYRAEWELEAGQHDDAVTWARRAIEAARAVNRRKYEISSSITLGSALAAQGMHEAATEELRTACSAWRTGAGGRRSCDGAPGPPSVPPRGSGPRPRPRARPRRRRPRRSSVRSQPGSLPSAPTDTWRPRRWRGSWTPRASSPALG